MGALGYIVAFVAGAITYGIVEYAVKNPEKTGQAIGKTISAGKTIAQTAKQFY